MYVKPQETKESRKNMNRQEAWTKALQGMPQADRFVYTNRDQIAKDLDSARRNFDAAERNKLKAAAHLEFRAKNYAQATVDAEMLDMILENLRLDTANLMGSSNVTVKCEDCTDGCDKCDQ